MILRRQQQQRGDDWDAQLVRNYRAQGGQGFQPVDIDFFFGVPDEAHCEPLAGGAAGGRLRGRLQAGHQRRRHRLLAACAQGAASVGGHDAGSFASLQVCWPVQQGATYDGWAAEGVTKVAEDGTQRLRPQGIRR